MVGVIPAIEPIASAENAVHDEPGLAIDEFALFLPTFHQIHKTVVVAGHHGNDFVLALAGERIEFVQEQAEGNLVLDDVINLRADGAFELLDRLAFRIDMLRDIGIAVFDARQPIETLSEAIWQAVQERLARA